MKSMIFPLLCCFSVAMVPLTRAATAKPNVILILTDDQGYGDLACHGNPIIKTPNMDKLHSESLRFTDFHVNPFCTPTRAAVMTGRFPGRTGAYRTSSGRTLMHADEITAANLFSYNGYVTGLVGKWHLGDNAPHRPQDRGFQEVLWHKGGGVGQGPDYWGNDYFDDTYERVTAGGKQGKLEKFEGYCTDVWFAEATRFLERNHEKPFFLYLATNAPHGPYRVGNEWSDPYRDVNGKSVKEFYGMIANIDHNLGKFRQRLQELGLAENTILIFMSDNGTAKGAGAFNAGMKGQKGSLWDGGHRVPFFLHWPKGDLAKPQDVDALAAHIDVLPTLADLCGLKLPKAYKPDGVSLTSVLRNPTAVSPRQNYVLQYHGGIGLKKPIEPWTQSVVATAQWRLIEGKQLFDIKNDPAQREDVAADYPEVLKSLREQYTPWWDSVSPRMIPVRIDLGNPAENPTQLNSQDWYMKGRNPPWSQGAIKGLPSLTGPWHVDVKKAGRYRLTLRQLPKEADAVIKAVRAKVEIAGKEAEARIEPGSKSVVIEVELPAGPTTLVTYLYDSKGNAGGAYYTEVEAL